MPPPRIDTFTATGGTGAVEAGELRESAWVLAAESCERWERDNEGFVTGERGHCSANDCGTCWVPRILPGCWNLNLKRSDLELKCNRCSDYSSRKSIDFEQHQRLRRLMFSVKKHT